MMCCILFGVSEYMLINICYLVPTSLSVGLKLKTNPKKQGGTKLHHYRHIQLLLPWPTAFFKLKLCMVGRGHYSCTISIEKTRECFTFVM